MKTNGRSRARAPRSRSQRVYIQTHTRTHMCITRNIWDHVMCRTQNTYKRTRVFVSHNQTQGYIIRTFSFCKQLSDPYIYISVYQYDALQLRVSCTRGTHRSAWLITTATNKKSPTHEIAAHRVYNIYTWYLTEHATRHYKPKNILAKLRRPVWTLYVLAVDRFPELCTSYNIYIYRMSRINHGSIALKISVRDKYF